MTVSNECISANVMIKEVVERVFQRIQVVELTYPAVSAGQSRKSRTAQFAANLKQERGIKRLRYSSKMGVRHQTMKAKSRHLPELIN